MDEMLRKASRRTSLHMPGAQGRAPFGRVDPYRLDTTELPVTDDLYRPEGAIAQAQAMAAKSAGAAGTLLLHGGSTAGIHAMLLYAAKRGEKVILPRNAHISAVNLCAVAGLEPVFVQPAYTAKGRPYLTAESYRRVMSQNPEAKAALVVRPDFYGVQCDLEAIAREAHRLGMLVLCDEAHGAHFNWHEGYRTALACGADLAVQSAHKTLPALTAGAWLHAGAGVDAARLRRLLRMVQTSSPSFVNMLSLDDARAWMDAHGPDAINRLSQAVKAFLRKAEGLGYQNGQADFPTALGKDPLRLVLDAPQGGFWLAEQLAASGLDVEMSDSGGVVCILSLMDGARRLKRLYRALAALGAQPLAQTPPLPLPAELPKRVAPLGEAAFAPCESVGLAEAAGRVSAGYAGLYPPGVALLTPGEAVTPEMAAYLSSLPPARVFGLNPDGGLNCMITKGVQA